MGGDFHLPPKIEGFQVLKLECSSNGGPLWVKVDDLGDRILFVSDASNKFISTNSGVLKYQLNGEKLERDCIYFAYHYPCSESPSDGPDIGMFSMTNKTIRRFDFSKSYSCTPLPTRPVWFTPSLEFNYEL